MFNKILTLFKKSEESKYNSPIVKAVLYYCIPPSVSEAFPSGISIKFITNSETINALEKILSDTDFKKELLKAIIKTYSTFSTTSGKIIQKNEAFKDDTGTEKKYHLYYESSMDMSELISLVYEKLYKECVKQDIPNCNFEISLSLENSLDKI